MGGRGHENTWRTCTFVRRNCALYLVQASRGWAGLRAEEIRSLHFEGISEQNKVAP